MKLIKLIRYENDPATLEATWVRYDQLPDTQVAATPALYDGEGNEVAPAVEAHTVPGEILETVLRCHAYHATQMQELRADLGADAAQHETLIAEVEASYVPVVVPPYVPAEVSMRQARLALVAAGLYDQAQAAVANLGPTAIIEWEYATTVRRDHALVVGLGQALGVSEQTLDALFQQAATL